MVSPSCPSCEEILLEVDCEGCTGRVLVRAGPTYAAIDRAVQEIFPQRSACEAMYLNKDGDSCSLGEQTFPDFLCTAKKTATNQVLKLLLSHASVPSTGQADAEKAAIASESLSTPWQHEEQSDEVDKEGFCSVTDLTDIPDGGHVWVEFAEEELPAVQSACLTTDSQEIKEDMGAECEFQGVAEEKVAESECEVANEESGIILPFSESQLPTRSAAGERCNSLGNVQPGHSAVEMVDIIILAFDETGNAHLNFAESNALQEAAGGGHLSLELFQTMCADWGEDAQVGLGRDALMCIYEFCRMHHEALRMDFEAAKRKLQSVPTQEVLCERDECRRPPPLPAHLFLQCSGSEVASRIMAHAQQLRCCLGSTTRTLL